MIRFSTRRSIFVLAFTGVLALSACSDEKATPTPPTPAPSQIGVNLKEWAVTVAPSAGPVGPTRFSATNSGAIEHELVVIKTDLAIDDLPVEGGKVNEAGAGTVINEIPEFAPGLTIPLDLDLSAGKYALICNIVGHYELGMRATYFVE